MLRLSTDCVRRCTSDICDLWLKLCLGSQVLAQVGEVALFSLSLRPAALSSFAGPVLRQNRKWSQPFLGNHLLQATRSAHSVD